METQCPIRLFETRLDWARDLSDFVYGIDSEVGGDAKGAEIVARLVEPRKGQVALPLRRACHHRWRARRISRVRRLYGATFEVALLPRRVGGGGGWRIHYHGRPQAYMT